jgi:nitrite reductase (NADH) small subunit
VSVDGKPTELVWVTVCRRSDVPRDRGWPVRVGELNIAIFAPRGALRAVENVCRHVGNPLDDGQVRGGCVTCPWHGWKYDLSTGDHMTVFGRRPGIRTFPVRLAGEEVQVAVEAPYPT